MMKNKILLPFLFGAFLASGCNLLEDSVATMKNLNCALGSKQDCNSTTTMASNKESNVRYYKIKPKFKYIPKEYRNKTEDLPDFVVKTENGEIKNICVEIDGTKKGVYCNTFYDLKGNKITKISMEQADREILNGFMTHVSIAKQADGGTIANCNKYTYLNNAADFMYTLNLTAHSYATDWDQFILEDTLDLSEILSEIQNK